MGDEVWEPLVELTLYFRQQHDSLYCLCSRAFLRSQIGEDRWNELILDVDKLDTPEDETNFPALENLNLEHAVIPVLKKHELEATSCYCSASHYSTDDYESVMQSASEPHQLSKDVSACPLQNSDSGADLSEHLHDRLYPCIAEEPAESSRSELTIEWERHWADNGEALIWKSWIERYGLYINPSYEVAMTQEGKKAESKDIPDVKVTYSEDGEEDKIGRADSFGSGSGYDRLRHGPRSRCSSNSVSGKSLANMTVTTDSMTNVTKITVSSLDLSCECESEHSGSSISSSTDPSSGPSSESSQEDTCPENDAWWRRLWKEHYDTLFTESFSKFEQHYIAQHAVHEVAKESSEDEKQLEEAKAQLIKKFCSDNEGSGSGDDSALLRRLGEVNAPEEDTAAQTRVRLLGRFGAGSQQHNSFQSWSYLNSVGCILQKLNETAITDDCDVAPADADGKQPDGERAGGGQAQDAVDGGSTGDQGGAAPGNKRALSNDDADDDPLSPKRQVTNLRSHETATVDKKDSKTLERVKGAMMLMHLPFEPLEDAVMTHGHVKYRKRNIRAQNRRLKLTEARQRTHIFFDDEGNVSRKEATVLPEPPAPEPELNEGYEAHSSSIDDDNDQPDAAETVGRKQKKKKKKQKKLGINGSLPPEILEHKGLYKYWHRRFQLFLKYDQGIRLDAESWFSVTPEKVASHQAERCRCDVIIDAFCGSGGNTIQFAFTCERVIAIDLDPAKIELARHNAQVYGVADRIEFLVGDFTQLAPRLQADVVFLSPPWGGPDYLQQDVFSLDALLPPVGGSGLLALAQGIASDVAFFLPRNVNTYEVSLLAGPGGAVEIEQNFLDSKLIGVTAYLGELVRDPDNPDGLEL